MKDLPIRIEYIGGNCPVQAEGFIGGKPFYFRARWLSWSIGIGGDDCICNPEWSTGADYGSMPGDAGWMPQHKALEVMASAFAEYCQTQVE